MTDREAIARFEPYIGNECYRKEFQEACALAIYALQEREGSKGCRFCFDATLEPDLEGCDLSYHYVGESEQQKRIMIRSGNRKPMAIIFEELRGNQWHTVGILEPKFCPMCGRPLKGEDHETDVDPMHAAGACYCRECTFWNRHDDILSDGRFPDWGYCSKMLDSDSEIEITTLENDFCSWGQRREDTK